MTTVKQLQCKDADILPLRDGGLPALAVSLRGDIHNPLGLIAALLQRLSLLRAHLIDGGQGCEVLNRLMPCRIMEATSNNSQSSLSSCRHVLSNHMVSALADQ